VSPVSPGVGVSPVPLAVTVTTNQGKVRVEYPYASPNSVEVLGFTLHQVQAGETAQIGGTTLRLKRIGHAWRPPATNNNYGYQSNVPATFYRPDLQLMTEAEVIGELPDRWSRDVDCRDNLPSYRFDLEIQGDPWKVLNVELYDARTHVSLTSGGSYQEIKHGYKYSTSPYLWHEAPVELIVDVGTGPLEEEEIPVQVGASFTIASCRYQLLHGADDANLSSYGSGSSGKKVHVEFHSSSGGQPQRRKECLLIFHATQYPVHNAFEIEYLDSNGKKLETAGGSSGGGQIIQNVRAQLADIHKIRVRKYRTGHRVIIHLPRLPGLPPENRQVDNLFLVRVPILKFSRQYEQEEYLRRMTQLGLPYIPYTNTAAMIYPRWLTNATTLQVLDDYAHMMGVQGQLYVNQETLQIENGQRPWLMKLREKIQATWEKLRGP